VTRHAKASTAASISNRGATTRPAKTDATRVASSDAKGSSAPSVPKRLALALIAASCLFAALATSASAAAPAVTIQPASQVGFTTALAKGTVDPADHETSYRFDYITEALFQENLTNSQPAFQGAGSAGAGALAEGAGETAVQTPLESLAPNTTYHLRLFAENNQGEHVEAIAATFTTKATTPPVLAVKAPEASYLKAHLAATIDPEGGNVNPIGPTAVPFFWQLQFSAVSEPGNWQLAGGGEIKEAQAEANTPVEVQGEATGLHPSTPYITRLVVNYAGIETIAAEEPGFETLAVAKPTTTINPVTTFAAHTAQLTGHIDPNSPQAEGSTSPAEEEAFKTTYHFQCNPACLGLEEKQLAADNTAHAVSAAATGLHAGLLYHVELIASNAGGKETAGPITFTTEALPPVIDSTFATEVGETEATLGAKVNPGGASTTTHFDYITAAQFEADGNSFGAGTEETPESTSIGSNDEDQSAEAELSELEADTAYRYRVVATNAKSPTGTPGPVKAFHTTAASSAFSGCANEAIRRQNNSTGLADCRAYEMVSPVDKGGFGAYYNTLPVPAQAAPSGEKIAYQGVQAFPGAQGNSVFYSAHLSARTANGWQTTDWTPPAPKPAYIHEAFYDFSEDLTQAVIKVPLVPVAPGATPGVYNLFLRHPDGAYSWINAATPTVLPKEVCPPEELLSCWEFVDLAAFAGASADFSHVLFESAAQLKPEAPGTGTPALYESESSSGQVSLVGILPDEQPAATSTAGAGSSAAYTSEGGYDSRVEHAISADGSRVVFQAPSDEGKLPAETGQSGLTEVYDRIGGSETVELSAPNPGATPENPAAKPATFWAATPDGSRVFFTSAAELTTQSKTGDEGGEDLYEYDFNKPVSERVTDLSVGPAPHGARVLGVVNPSADGAYIYFVAKGQLDGSKGTEGKPNLYMAKEGEAPVFITTLGDVDAADWSSSTVALKAAVAPDGKHMVFMSALSLVTENFPEGYDNAEQSQVYEWSAEGGELLCASCDPSGKRPLGSAVIGSSAAQTPFYQMRMLSENGARLFYTAPGRHGIPSGQVYEYERSGEGSCAAASGCHYLISDPRAEEPEVFLGASADGRDVFFTTPDRLTPGDEDNLIDVYDARAGGGFAMTPPTPPCEAEGCRGPGSSRSPSSSAGTSQFIGPEEGPKHPKKSHNRKKHHKKKAHKKQGRAANSNRGGGK
jgi:hypothetical protein